MLQEHLLLQNGHGGGLTATVVSWSGVSPEDANSRVGRQLRIDVTDSREKVRVHRRVAESVGRLGCGLPNLRQLGRGHVLASNVTVEGQLLRSAAAFHNDGSHLFREAGTTNHSD